MTGPSESEPNLAVIVDPPITPAATKDASLIVTAWRIMFCGGAHNMPIDFVQFSSLNQKGKCHELPDLQDCL
jgi:hypothetical protein